MSHLGIHESRACNALPLRDAWGCPRADNSWRWPQVAAQTTSASGGSRRRRTVARAHADAHRPPAHRHRSRPDAALSSLWVPFAHCEDTFPPPQNEYPEWSGYDQIDERGFRDAA
jgi:hypothetical protein